MNVPSAATKLKNVYQQPSSTCPAPADSISVSATHTPAAGTNATPPASSCACAYERRTPPPPPPRRPRSSTSTPHSAAASRNTYGESGCGPMGRKVASATNAPTPAAPRSGVVCSSVLRMPSAAFAALCARNCASRSGSANRHVRRTKRLAARERTAPPTVPCRAGATLEDAMDALFSGHAAQP